MQARELERLAAEIGIDAIGAAAAEPYDGTERHIRDRRARGLFADMRFTMAQPEVSCHPEKLVPNGYPYGNRPAGFSVSGANTVTTDKNDPNTYGNTNSGGGITFCYNFVFFVLTIAFGYLAQAGAVNILPGAAK